MISISISTVLPTGFWLSPCNDSFKKRHQRWSFDIDIIIHPTTSLSIGTSAQLWPRVTRGHYRNQHQFSNHLDIDDNKATHTTSRLYEFARPLPSCWTIFINLMVLKGNKRSIRSLTKPRSIIFCAREASTGPSSYINRKHLDTEDMREKLSVPFKFAIYSRDGDGDFNAFRENYKRMRSISASTSHYHRHFVHLT